MFKTRLISGIVLIAILLAGILLGGWVFWALVLFVSAVGLHELYRLENIDKSALFAASVIGALAYAISLRPEFAAELRLFVLLGVLLALAIIFVLTYPRYQIKQIILAFFSFFYVPVMIFCLYLIRSMPGGAYMIWLAIIASWGCDTGAYCVGMLFGKHKLAPVLSPNKSVEGAVGGVVVSALLGLLLAVIFRDKLLSVFNHPILACGLISAIGAVIAQFGDLMASAIKRSYGIKDYGKLIPGHGGIMDRFDSVIFVSPVIYALVFMCMYIK